MLTFDIPGRRAGHLLPPARPSAPPTIRSTGGQSPTSDSTPRPEVASPHTIPHRHRHVVMHGCGSSSSLRFFRLSILLGLRRRHVVTPGIDVLKPAIVGRRILMVPLACINEKNREQTNKVYQDWRDQLSQG